MREPLPWPVAAGEVREGPACPGSVPRARGAGGSRGGAWIRQTSHPDGRPPPAAAPNGSAAAGRSSPPRSRRARRYGGAATAADDSGGAGWTRKWVPRHPPRGGTEPAVGAAPFRAAASREPDPGAPALAGRGTPLSRCCSAGAGRNSVRGSRGSAWPAWHPARSPSAPRRSDPDPSALGGSGAELCAPAPVFSRPSTDVGPGKRVAARGGRGTELDVPVPVGPDASRTLPTRLTTRRETGGRLRRNRRGAGRAPIPRVRSPPGSRPAVGGVSGKRAGGRGGGGGARRVPVGEAGSGGREPEGPGVRSVSAPWRGTSPGRSRPRSSREAGGACRRSPPRRGVRPERERGRPGVPRASYRPRRTGPRTRRRIRRPGSSSSPRRPDCHRRRIGPDRRQRPVGSGRRRCRVAPARHRRRGSGAPALQRLSSRGPIRPRSPPAFQRPGRRRCRVGPDRHPGSRRPATSSVPRGPGSSPSVSRPPAVAGRWLGVSWGVGGSGAACFGAHATPRFLVPGPSPSYAGQRRRGRPARTSRPGTHTRTADRHPGAVGDRRRTSSVRARHSTG